MILAGRQYRPDFYLPQYDLFVEICGYNHMPFYRDRIEQKRKLYAEQGLNAAFVYYNGKGRLQDAIQSELDKLGIRLNLDRCHSDE
jgi:hypothetical protein